MKERPILFSAPMVRAILAGTKTQTRRLVKPTSGRPIEFLGCGGASGPDWNNPECWGYEWHDGPEFVTLKPSEDSRAYPCPHGEPGDRLWVRETFFAWGRWEQRFSEKKGRDEWHFVDMTRERGESYLYAADGVRNTRAFIKRRGDPKPMYWQRPSIHMPRWASRITLEITGVRVERLQAISEADALEEGVTELTRAVDRSTRWHPVSEFRALWESINGPGSWDANPWVWCVEFKRVNP